VVVRCCGVGVGTGGTGVVCSVVLCVVWCCV